MQSPPSSQVPLCSPGWHAATHHAAYANEATITCEVQSQNVLSDICQIKHCSFFFQQEGSKYPCSCTYGSFRHMPHVHTHSAMTVCLSAGSTASQSWRTAVHCKKVRDTCITVIIPFHIRSLCFEMSFSLFFVWSLLMCVSSFTDTDPLCYSALFTHHVAAPVELAVAAFTPCLLQDVMASTAAQALTVVHARAGLVADPALRSCRIRPQVPLTEIW